MSSLPDGSTVDDKLLRLSATMDEFEGYPAGQANRIAWIADMMGEKLGLAARDRESLEHAALLHDIGEVKMAREYIRAARSLTTHERLDLERHPVIGEQEIARLELPRSTQLIVRWHHEWWNGSGYPDRLEAEQIPLSARILRLADAFCSLTADRPWRRGMTEEEARQHLVQWAGLEFDPGLVAIFRSIQVPALQPQPEDPTPVFSTFR